MLMIRALKGAKTEIDSRGTRVTCGPLSKSPLVVMFEKTSFPEVIDAMIRFSSCSAERRR